MTTKILTTTISSDLYNWLDKTSKSASVTKRSILESALRKHRLSKMEKDLSETFLRANNDPEMFLLAEENLGDHAN